MQRQNNNFEFLETFSLSSTSYMPILKYGNAKLTKVNNKLCLFLFASSLDSILILILEIETETAEN